MIIERIRAKSLIKEVTPSFFSWAKVYLNPYQGCWHDCKYCDGKAESYYMHEDFANRIKVKVNAPELLEKYLKKRGFFSPNSSHSLLNYLDTTVERIHMPSPSKFVIFVGGGVCDVYQPAEKELQLTRKLLQIICDYELPVFILTKSTLVLRDLDLLKAINNQTYASVNFTITLADDSVRKIFEPRASSSEDRFQAISQLRKEGIHSGVYFYPCLPFIGDTTENIENIFRRAKKVNAEYVITWGLTLKPGRNKDEFIDTLRKHYPHLVAKYLELYGNNDKYGNFDKKVFKRLGLVFPRVKAFRYNYEMKLGYSPIRYIPKQGQKVNLILSEILLKISHLKGFIMHKNYSFIKELYSAALYLDSLEVSIEEILETNVKLPISKSVLSIIQDYLEKGYSSILQETEEEAYYHSLQFQSYQQRKEKRKNSL
ncbi:MAG: radical SAM protein [Candidatus Heimdallarchaeaceae archaeon]